MDAFPVKIADDKGDVVAEAAGELDGLALLIYLPAGEYRVGDARARVSRAFDWDGDLVLVDCGTDLRPWHCLTARHPESSLIDPRIRGRLLGWPTARPVPPAERPVGTPRPRGRRAGGVLVASVLPTGEAGVAP